MSTNFISPHEEIFSAFADAVAAYRREPEVVLNCKKAEEDRDFARLELDEARAEIDRLRAKVCGLEDELSARAAQIDSLCTELTLLRDAKNIADDALSGARHVIDDIKLANSELSARLEIAKANEAALLVRLEDSRGYGSRLAEMLKGFGSAIQSAVAEPAVSDSAPFPSNPVGMPVSTELKSIAPSLDEVGNQPSPALDMASPERVVSVAETVKLDGEFTKDAVQQFETPWWNR